MGEVAQIGITVIIILQNNLLYILLTLSRLSSVGRILAYSLHYHSWFATSRIWQFARTEKVSYGSYEVI